MSQKLNTRLSTRGFSLPELMVVLAIIGILSSTGISQYGNVMRSFKKVAALEQIKSDIRRTKLESLAQGGRGILTDLTDNNGYVMGIDYLPFGSSAVIDTQLFATRLDRNVSVSFSQDLIFDSRGFLVTAAGVPTSATFSLRYYGSVYCTGTVFSTGSISTSCS